VISFIIPAHNEEALLGRTLAALHAAARALGGPYEVVVADDASTDRTAAIAHQHGARVVAVNRRQIAAARNAGARAATGDVLFFVDADTVVTRRVLQAALRALRAGVVGGGCTVRIDGKLPPYAVVLERLLGPVSQAIGLAGGCFLFCTRRAYRAAGGFDESVYVAEEVFFSRQLKRRGRFVILRESVVTSGRKLRAYGALDLLRVGVRLTLGGRRALGRREGLEYWYGPREVIHEDP
jgi:glycosyltransferase involved in cell wall biosynthesis